MILPFLLALVVSIVIVITPVEAKKKGGHDRGGGYSDDHDDDKDDDDHDGGYGDPDPPGPTNGGGPKKSRDRDGGECFAVDGVNPCITYRPKPNPNPIEIAPGVFQYYGAFGQVVGTSIVTRYESEPAAIVPRETLTSSPELEPQVLGMDPEKPQPVAIVKKAVQDLEHEKAQVVRKRTIQPAEKSADQILDVLIIQALERQTNPAVLAPVQKCNCEAIQ